MGLENNGDRGNINGYKFLDLMHFITSSAIEIFYLIFWSLGSSKGLKVSELFTRSIGGKIRFLLLYSNPWNPQLVQFVILQYREHYTVVMLCITFDTKFKK